LAPFYDRYTEHPAYSGWIQTLEALARRYGLRGRRALDVGCGTGKSLMPLMELGYEAVGCDPSTAMLSAARAKLGPRAGLVQAGLPELPDLGAFDYVTCLNDVMNCVDASALGAAVGALARNLRTGGVLVFDTTTLTAFRSFFGADHIRARDGHLFAWRAATPPDLAAGERAEAWLDVFVPCGDGRHRRIGAAQLQQHHPEAAVEAAVAAAGLELRARLGQPAEGRPRWPLDPARDLKTVWMAAKL
jgi:SAM-dependent methyltransferase